MSRKRNLTDEEDRLWRQVMRGTEPSGRVIKEAANRADVHRTAVQDKAHPVPAPTHLGHPPAPKKTAKTTPPVIRHTALGPGNRQNSGDLSNLDRKEKQRVLRG